jgi:alanyl-tRNA synthetase
LSFAIVRFLHKKGPLYLVYRDESINLLFQETTMDVIISLLEPEIYFLAAGVMVNKKLSSNDIRQRFFDFFIEQGHEQVPGSSLIPSNDPTLLFTNAGMVQFKDLFLGRERRQYTRAVSSQPCVRAGGKHNDLENVGFTARHHTFFEMLGNFSFGDYSKRQAIQYAWTFLTTVLGVSAEKLWITVYKDDQEAADIWLKEMGVSAERFSYCGDKDNFWAMGDTGPCGPCSEIFYDHGPAVAGGPPGSPDEEGDRYVEIWNLVFMQYNRDSAGKLTPLPKPSVDTGMGLERIAAVLQGVHSNYDIDLFQKIIHTCASIMGVKDKQHQSLKVIADHIRSCAFLIINGVRPSNEGRGYVLRRIIRRALRHGHKLGRTQPFFHLLLPALVQEMGDAYPELAAQQATIADVLLKEDAQFAQTLEKGMKHLEDDLASLNGTMISGATVFKLYDTYGFPLDLTADIARERGLKIDEAGFHRCMKAQQKRSQGASRFKAAEDLSLDGETHFTGYTATQAAACVVALFKAGQSVEVISKDDEAIVVLDETPFYAQSGGQVGDQGQLVAKMGVFQVQDTQKQGKGILQVGQMSRGTLTVGDQLDAVVDASRRKMIAANHSATHLLHAALRVVLGDHLVQKGSDVSARRLRFDFSHPEPVTPAALLAVERLTNQLIRNNDPVDVVLSTQAAAKKRGAMALFGEKYAAKVRVVQMGDASLELCGGTHVARTGDIGVLKITSETGIAAGVRRIEALCGEQAMTFIEQAEARLSQAAAQLKTRPAKLNEKLVLLQEQCRQQEKAIQALQQKMAGGLMDELIDRAQHLGDIELIVGELPGVDSKTLRETVDSIKNKRPNAVVLLASVNDGKVALVAGVAKNRLSQIHAGKLINSVAQQLGGRGGGRPDMAQAGATDVAALPNALASVASWVEKSVSGE